MFNKSKNSLKNFYNLFNEEKEITNLKIVLDNDDFTLDDGYIEDVNTGIKIGFDWAYRSRHFKNGKYKFKTLGQDDKKIKKKSIDLTIQCDSTQTAIVVAWHQDWEKENPTNLNLTRDIDEDRDVLRYTRFFKVYTYSEIKEFKEMLNRAIDNKQYNYNSF